MRQPSIWCDAVSTNCHKLLDCKPESSSVTVFPRGGHVFSMKQSARLWVPQVSLLRPGIPPS
jgi:hypothetical protein